MNESFNGGQIDDDEKREVLSGLIKETETRKMFETLKMGSNDVTNEQEEKHSGDNSTPKRDTIEKLYMLNDDLSEIQKSISADDNTDDEDVGIEMQALTAMESYAL